MAPPRIPNIKHLAFDLYGTLLTSNAGGSYTLPEREKILRRHLALPNLPGYSLVTHFENLIAQDHASSRKSGIDFPEVEIRKIWNRFFESLKLPLPADLESFITTYEHLINPVTLMPGTLEILSHPFTCAFVSNAQFYTPPILAQLGIPTPKITLYSFESGHAKPGRYLFEKLAQKLSPAETLYLGNDRLNDIAPAHQCGFRTALFSGDSTSYRPHDHRLDLPRPDATISEFAQISEILGE